MKKGDASGTAVGPDEEKVFGEASVKRALSLVDDLSVRAIASDFSKNLAEEAVDLGFNVFSIVSETYHRENFHSDMLLAFLKPRNAHGHGSFFLHSFLKFLGNRMRAVCAANYPDPTVESEVAIGLEDEDDGRIDILIKDETTRHAIIIENKINNARSMPRQIPRYFKYVNKRYSCDAVVYLRLLDACGPDMSDWSKKEKERIKGLLIAMPAYDGAESPYSLYGGWIKRCMEDCKQGSDAQFLFRQYGILLKSLGKKNMNKPIVEKFYESLQGGVGRFQAARELNNLVDALAPYLLQRIVDKFQHDPTPFEKVAIWKNFVCFTELRVDGAHLCVDVEALEWNTECPRFRFWFWDREDGEGTKRNAEKVLRKMGLLRHYMAEGGYYRLKEDFEFPAGEVPLERHIRNFNRELQKCVEGT